jgi:adenylate cyclase
VTTNLSRLCDFAGRQYVVVPLIALVVSILTIGLRSLGGLERLDLTAYDWCMALRPAKATAHRVVLIGITEEDISALGKWPLSDATLAKALSKLGQYQPAAIGVDLYRNLPVPPGSPELEQTVLNNPRIVMIRKFGDLSSPGVPPPSYLNGEGGQTGFSDLVVDSGGVVRRGLLFLDDGRTVYPSLSLRLATLYLATKGVSPQPDPLIPAQIRLGRTTIPPLGPDDGGYAHIDAAGYQFLLDFRDQTTALPVFSLADLLAGRIDDNELRGRIVILGTMAASMHDAFFTPVRLGGERDGLMPGMTLHGHAASQLVRLAMDEDQPVTMFPKTAETGWIVFWCLMGGLIGLWIRSPLLWSLVSATVVTVIAALAILAFSVGWWVPMIPPALGLLVTAGVTTAYYSHEEGKSRASLMDLFSRHVSEEVANTLWRQRRQFMNSGRPLPQRLTATVLFTDLVGFTTIAERLEPAVLMEWLNQYLEMMGREITAHGGIINKYIGDSIMAIFGVPVARLSEDDIRQDAVNAVRCAMAMRSAMREMNRQWTARGMMAVGTRIGISTGPLVAGSLGGAARMEYTVIGDTVNIASRLEGFDKEGFLFHPYDNPCRILLGSTTKAYLDSVQSSLQSDGDSFQSPLVSDGDSVQSPSRGEWTDSSLVSDEGGGFSTRLIGDIRLKGKDMPVSVYELLSEEGVTAGHPG